MHILPGTGIRDHHGTMGWASVGGHSLGRHLPALQASLEEREQVGAYQQKASDIIFLAGEFFTKLVAICATIQSGNKEQGENLTVLFFFFQFLLMKRSWIILFFCIKSQTQLFLFKSAFS